MQPLKRRLPAITPREVSMLAMEWCARTGGVLRRLRPAAFTPVIVGTEVVLTVVLAAVSATLIWKAFEPPAWASSNESALTSAPARRTTLPMVLTEVDPFHRAVAGGRSAVAALAPETMLDLQLFGIRAGVGDTAGSAIVAKPDKLQGVYTIGQEIMPGVRLEEIRPDRVVIRRNGVTESLSFDRDSAIRQNAAAPSGAIAQVPVVAADAHRLDLDAMKSLAMVLRSVPVERAGTSGLVLAGSADPALLRQAGLESGDLLVSVNGTPISDVGSFASLATLTAQGLTLEIERKGQRKFHRLAIDR
jgi:general secretion pathway protein C